MSKASKIKRRKQKKLIMGLSAAVILIAGGTFILADFVKAAKEIDLESLLPEALRNHADESSSSVRDDESKEWELPDVQKPDSSSADTNSLGFEIDKDTIAMLQVEEGDTYYLSVDGERTRTRLIGVSIPVGATVDGRPVKDIVEKEFATGTVFTVEYDMVRYNMYGMLLVYLYREDGTMVQDWLLENGYAQTLVVQPNSMYTERFAEIEQDAKERGVGIWADITEGSDSNVETERVSDSEA